MIESLKRVSGAAESAAKASRQLADSLFAVADAARKVTP
jgi:hypothetical protein